MSRVRLRPLLAVDLPLVDTWFEDAETRRWLGGQGWAAIGLGLAGPDRHVLLGMSGDLPVGLADVEIDADSRASFALAIDPARRRQGFGSGLVEAIAADVRLGRITELYAGVENGNLASQRLLERCGFVQTAAEDDEGFVSYARRLRPA